MSERDWKDLLPRAARVLERLEDWLAERSPGPTGQEPAGTGEVWAYRFRGDRLQPIHHPDLYPLEGLIGVERSVARLRANGRAFVAGQPALDTLLYGERGTGKSSAVRGLLRELGAKGLRLIEVDREQLAELPRVYAAVRGREERFVLFCDDLSFEAGDDSYKSLKACLDGGLEERPANLILMATSNRRHLIPEFRSENLEARLTPDGELHPGETAEEKLSLSDRFGLLLPFLSFDQDTYLRIVDYHARELGLVERVSPEELRAFVLRFALERAGRSGRTARQACIALMQTGARGERP